MTEARRRANAIRNWRHGLRSETGIRAKDVLRAKLKKVFPKAVDVFDACEQATFGDTAKTDALSSSAMAQSEVIRQLVTQDMLERGEGAPLPRVSARSLVPVGAPTNLAPTRF
jgi:hypothetical protein